MSKPIDKLAIMNAMGDAADKKAKMSAEKEAPKKKAPPKKK